MKKATVVYTILTIEIASILVMWELLWVPHFCTPFVHYPTYRGCAQRWGELTGWKEELA